MILRQCTNQPGFFLECHKCFFINQYKDPIPLDKKNHYSTLVTTIIWVWPLPSNSDHQDYYIFSTESLYKPLFATFTGKGPYPNLLQSYFRLSRLCGRKSPRIPLPCWSPPPYPREPLTLAAWSRWKPRNGGWNRLGGWCGSTTRWW